jgi:hypothetical protein
MPPNTTHAVITLAPSVTHGCHFYHQHVWTHTLGAVLDANLHYATSNEFYPTWQVRILNIMMYYCHALKEFYRRTGSTRTIDEVGYRAKVKGGTPHK